MVQQSPGWTTESLARSFCKYGLHMWAYNAQKSNLIVQTQGMGGKAVKSLPDVATFPLSLPARSRVWHITSHYAVG